MIDVDFALPGSHKSNAHLRFPLRVVFQNSELKEFVSSVGGCEHGVDGGIPHSCLLQLIYAWTPAVVVTAEDGYIWNCIVCDSPEHAQ